MSSLIKRQPSFAFDQACEMQFKSTFWIEPIKSGSRSRRQTQWVNFYRVEEWRHLALKVKVVESYFQDRSGLARPTPERARRDKFNRLIPILDHSCSLKVKSCCLLLKQTLPVINTFTFNQSKAKQLSLIKKTAQAHWHTLSMQRDKWRQYLVPMHCRVFITSLWNYRVELGKPNPYLPTAKTTFIRKME